MKIFSLMILLIGFTVVAAQVPCKQAYTFAGGANDKITLPLTHALYDTSGFTWEAWIWVDSVPATATVNPNIGQVIIAAADAQNCADIGLSLGWGNWAENKLIFTADGEGCNRDPNPPSYTGLVSKRWYHVAGVADYESGWMYLYVDGQMVSSSNYFGQTPAYRPFQANVVMNIGNLEINNSGFGFKGYIDEVRIWNVLRSASEIQNNMYECLTGNETGLVAYYNAQHGAGTIAEDKSSNNYNGTLKGTASTIVNISPALVCCVETPQSECLGSYQFTGTNGEMIALPTTRSLYPTSGFTWEAWIKPADIASGIDTVPNPNIGQVILSAADGQNCADIGLSLGWGNWAEHRLIFTADGSGCVRDPNPPSYTGFQNNIWYHVAAVADYTGGSAKLYINGNLVSSSNYFGNTPSYSPFTTVVSVQIGNLDYGAKTFPFNGLIDEVRIWNTVRTANEINTNKDVCLTGSEAGLVAYYKADEQTSDTAYDQKGLYHGDIMGTVTRNSENAPMACCTTSCNLASPTITSSQMIFCASDSAQVCAPIGFSTYDWNTGETTRCIITRNAGNYYVTVTDNSGCTAESNHLSLSVHPQPPVSIIVQGDTLSSFGAVNYQWYFNGNKINGATSAIYVASQKGSYTLEITDANGCTSRSTPVVISGIDQIYEEPLMVYPNPASNVLTIITSSRERRVILTNLLGEVLRDERIIGGRKEIDISHLPSGMYFVNNRKLVKE